MLLGTGKRLFDNGTVPTRFALTETKTSSTGVVLHVHTAAGSLEHGSFQVEPPTQAEIERRQKVEVGG